MELTKRFDESIRQTREMITKVGIINANFFICIIIM